MTSQGSHGEKLGVWISQCELPGPAEHVHHGHPPLSVSVPHSDPHPCPACDDLVCHITVCPDTVSHHCQGPNNLDTKVEIKLLHLSSPTFTPCGCKAAIEAIKPAVAAAPHLSRDIPATSRCFKGKTSTPIHINGNWIFQNIVSYGTVFTCHDSSSLDVSATGVIGDPLANLSQFGEVKFKYLGLEVFNCLRKQKNRLTKYTVFLTVPSGL